MKRDAAALEKASPANTNELRVSEWPSIDRDPNDDGAKESAATTLTTMIVILLTAIS